MNAPASLHSPERLRFRVDQFLALDAAGVLIDVGRTELVDGDIVPMNAQHRPHSRATFRLGRVIEDVLMALGSPLGVVVEGTVGMPPHNAPEPDLTVTSEPDGVGIVPLASVALLVEVSDTTLGVDLGRKAALYACHDVPEYWVVDLKGRRVVQLWGPTATGFTESLTIAFGAPLTIQTIAGAIVPTDELLALPTG